MIFFSFFWGGGGEDFKMNYKSEDLPRLPALIKYISRIKNFLVQLLRDWGIAEMYGLWETLCSFKNSSALTKKQHVNTFHKYKLCFVIKLLSLLSNELANQTKV